MLKRILILMVFAWVMLYPGCTTSEEAGQYTLTVTVSEGITGVPAAGTYNHAENDIVVYSYSLQPGYRNLTVVLDGVAMGATGTINMNASHTLVVAAEQIDIRGMWTGVFYWQGSSTYFEVTFSGGIAAGETEGLFDWVPGFGRGDYTVSGNQVDFNLEYNVCAINEGLSCTGTLADNNHMSGLWDWECNGIIRNETWDLER